MNEYRTGITQEMVDFTKGSLLKSNALRFETIDAKLGMLNTMTFFGLPFDYIKQEEDYLRGLTVEQVSAGDAATQMKGLKAVGFGEPVPVK